MEGAGGARELYIYMYLFGFLRVQSKASLALRSNGPEIRPGGRRSEAVGGSEQLQSQWEH
eukprot:3096268-Pyramimonas_sp.AAC.1